MFRLVRTAISLVFIALVLWFAFTVKLGEKSLAQHMDAFGGTPEAKELFDGARETVNPALEEAKERIIGEHVEAPTTINGVPAAPNYKPTAQVGDETSATQRQKDGSAPAMTQPRSTSTP